MMLEILNLLIGIVFGFIHRGKENYTNLLKNGALAGLLLGIIFVLAAEFLVPGWESIGAFGFPGVLGIFIEILLFLIIFIAGVFIGDRIECYVHGKK